MKQTGFVLVVSLIFLVLMTLLGLSMFGGFSTNQSIAGNLREKSRAEDAAQSALEYAEYWLLLQAGAPPTGVPCGAPSATPIVCTNALANPNAFSAAAAGATPFSMSNNFSSLIAAFYNAPPVFYIQYLSQQPSGHVGQAFCPCYFYQVTATGQGGGASNAVAVVQSVYVVGAGNNNASNPPGGGGA